MKSPKIKLYIGCALTYAPPDFIEAVEKFKQALSSNGYEILDFYGLHTVGTPKDVYKNDIRKCVRKCEAFIGICDYPSIGLGYEINEAVHLGRPVLAVAQAKTKVTRLVLGAAEVEPNFRFERYSDLRKDAILLVDSWLSKLK